VYFCTVPGVYRMMVKISNEAVYITSAWHCIQEGTAILNANIVRLLTNACDSPLVLHSQKQRTFHTLDLGCWQTYRLKSDFVRCCRGRSNFLCVEFLYTSVTWCESSWVDRSRRPAFAASWWAIFDSVSWNKCITVFPLMFYINKKKLSNQSRRYPDEVFILVLPPPTHLCIIIIIIIIIYFNNYNIVIFRWFLIIFFRLLFVYFSYVPVLSL
jgi:hypothetical protein